MNFALLGGDDRSLRLYRLLRADGHGVKAFALELALPDCAACAGDALAGADCVILPLPCEKDGALNAPYSAHRYSFSELFSAAPLGTPVCAGKAGESLRSVCRRQKLALSDYFLREDFSLKNAELTAEGALGLLLQGDRALRGSRVLIAGFGRIGRLLAAKLLHLGAHVIVTARKSEDRVLAELMGCEAVPVHRAAEQCPDAVVNTVPAPLFHEAELRAFGNSAKLIELASPPYGFDFAAAEAVGMHIELASGLPGKTAPHAAAAAVRDAVYAIMEG